jgi:hypothetical protein
VAAFSRAWKPKRLFFQALEKFLASVVWVEKNNRLKDYTRRP